MRIECMVMHDVQNESLVFLYQLGTLSPLPSGEKEVSQTPHCKEIKLQREEEYHENRITFTSNMIKRQ